MMRIFRVLLSLVIILGLLFALPALVSLSQQTTRTMTRATDIPARIVVDVNTILGPLPTSFRALSQGGEEPTRMFASIIPEVRQLAPRYIRIDHLYDFYDIVRKQDGQVSFDFSRLDGMVEDILATGALPFFSISYMPTAISTDGTILGLPTNWDDWSRVVGATIEHYSGRSQKNLTNVYYEIWNEPDLFGRFGIGGDKDYRSLYESAARGAAAVHDANPYFLGGPAITGPMSNWLTGLMQFVTERNIRLDFLSYHRYGANPSVYEKDADNVRRLTTGFAHFATIPLVLSEWGPNSEIDSSYDSVQSAAFTLATIRKIMDKVSLIMPFEVKDGPSPSGQEYWGRWGILTHEMFGKNPKPRYHALRLLNNLQGQRLGVTGEGTYISGIATSDSRRIHLILINYDQAGKNTEAVPVKLKGLMAKSYTIKERDMTQEVSSKVEHVTSGELSTSVLMPPYAIRLLEFTPLTDQSSYTLGKTGIGGDSAIVLDGKNPKLEYSPPQFALSRGTIEFSLIPSFLGSESTTVLFSMPVVLAKGTKGEFAAKKQQLGFSTKLVFGLFENNQAKQTVSASISDWKSGQWHDLGFGWSSDGLQLTLDGRVVDELTSPFSLGLGTVLTLENNGSTIDNLRFTDGVRTLTSRSFDGTTDH